MSQVFLLLFMRTRKERERVSSCFFILSFLFQQTLFFYFSQFQVKWQCGIWQLLWPRIFKLCNTSKIVKPWKYHFRMNSWQCCHQIIWSISIHGVCLFSREVSRSRSHSLYSQLITQYQCSCPVLECVSNWRVIVLGQNCRIKELWGTEVMLLNQFQAKGKGPCHLF